MLEIHERCIKAFRNFDSFQKEIKDTLARLSNKGGKSKSSKNRRIKRDSFAQKRQEEIEQAEADEKMHIWKGGTSKQEHMARRTTQKQKR